MLPLHALHSTAVANKTGHDCLYGTCLRQVVTQTVSGFFECADLLTQAGKSCPCVSRIGWVLPQIGSLPVRCMI